MRRELVLEELDELCAFERGGLEPTVAYARSGCCRGSDEMPACERDVVDSVLARAPDELDSGVDAEAAVVELSRDRVGRFEDDAAEDVGDVKPKLVDDEADMRPCSSTVWREPLPCGSMRRN